MEFVQYTHNIPQKSVCPYASLLLQAIKMSVPLANFLFLSCFPCSFISFLSFSLFF